MWWFLTHYITELRFWWRMKWVAVIRGIIYFIKCRYEEIISLRMLTVDVWCVDKRASNLVKRWRKYITTFRTGFNKTPALSGWVHQFLSSSAEFNFQRFSLSFISPQRLGLYCSSRTIRPFIYHRVEFTDQHSHDLQKNPQDLQKHCRKNTLSPDGGELARTNQSRRARKSLEENPESRPLYENKWCRSGPSFTAAPENLWNSD